MNLWSAYYLGVFSLFLGPELYWVFVNAKNTLSDQWWALEGLNHSHPYFTQWTDVHWLVALMVWALFLWLSLHLPFGLLG